MHCCELWCLRVARHLLHLLGLFAQCSQFIVVTLDEHRIIANREDKYIPSMIIGTGTLTGTTRKSSTREDETPWLRRGMVQGREPGAQLMKGCGTSNDVVHCKPFDFTPPTCACISQGKLTQQVWHVS